MVANLLGDGYGACLCFYNHRPHALPIPHRQILLAALVVLVAHSTTAAAFTPDAAFKMRTLVGTTQPSSPSNNDTGKRGIVVTPSSQSTRNMQLSLIGQAEYIRKSITVPPAYEDYMAVRQRSLLGLLNLKRDD